MKKREKKGDIVKVPFKEGFHTYARIIVDLSYAVYDYSTSEDEIDLLKIIDSEILFVAQVNTHVVEMNHWAIAGNIPLEDRLKTFYPRYFDTVFNPQTSLGFYKIYKDEIEKGIEADWIKTGKMQLGGIFSPASIEQRILDYYSGKRNEHNTRVVIMYKGFMNLPLKELENEKERLFPARNINSLESSQNDRVKSFYEIKTLYPFEDWKKAFNYGMLQFSPENCNKAKLIIDNLIEGLKELNENVSEQEKIDLFKAAINSFNKLNSEIDGCFIETSEREDLCHLINEITLASGLNPSNYGGGEGLASEWRDW